jgi:hypothetical protein
VKYAKTRKINTTCSYSFVEPKKPIWNEEKQWSLLLEGGKKMGVKTQKEGKEKRKRGRNEGEKARRKGGMEGGREGRKGKKGRKEGGREGGKKVTEKEISPGVL